MGIESVNEGFVADVSSVVVVVVVGMRIMVAR